VLTSGIHQWPLSQQISAMFDIRTSFHIVGIVPMSFEDMKTIIFSILEQIQQVLVESIKKIILTLYP